MAMNFTMTPASGSASSAAQVPSPGPQRMPVVDEVMLRQLFATSPLTGTPRYAAVRPKAGTGGANPQRHEVLFYPTPNDDLVLEFRYNVIPTLLSETNPYPHGGRQHAETILQSCLAVAEERKEKQRGPAYTKFMERLAASIQLDIQSLQPTADTIWPLDQDVDDLNLTKRDLQRIVGNFAGFGPHSGAWSHEQQQKVELATQNGLRAFYAPPILPNERNAHQWSFLRPVAEMGTVSGESTYELPADFAIIEGPFIHPPSASALYPAIPVIGEHQLRMRLQGPVSSGRPQLAAIRPKTFDAVSGTRYEVMFWPVPDDTYQLTFRYQRNPSLLPSHIALPLGGQPHTQTVLEACLAAMEELQPETVKVPGMHAAKFRECLAASVSHDRRANAPDTLGLQIDPSDNLPDSRQLMDAWRNCNLSPVTYNGLNYT